MDNSRIQKLAKILVDYSVFVKKGERVIVSADANSEPLVKELYKQILKKGAYPVLNLSLQSLSYIYFKHASSEQLKTFPEFFDYEVKHSQKYIGIGSPYNTRELSNIAPEKITTRARVTNPITDYIVNAKPKIYRVTLDYPTSALAQDAEMSLEEYENFLFSACLLDWKKLSSRFSQLAKVFNKATEFRVVGTDTDLKMNIHPNSFVIDDGKENMPGGEVFGAPSKYSVNGHIRFTYPAIRSGVEVTNIYCEFKKGKCVRAEADKNQNFLKKMLATDKGSCYLGEIGIGMNPKVNKFTKNLLFDEKIGGTVHFAFGMAYKECGQPNKSALHWDIVKDLRRDGKIYLDGKVVQKNGEWLV